MTKKKYMSELPIDWQRVKLGAVCERITKGATPTTYGFKFQKKGINFIKIENVKNGKILKETITDYISEDANKYQKKSQLITGDILFSIAGTIGEICSIKKEDLPANTNQAFAIIRGADKSFDLKFLQYQLELFVAQIQIKARGGAMNNVSLEDLKNFEVTLAPLSTQNRIVAKIDELFSELSKGIENLRQAQQQLKTYRQAVLKWAFEGRFSKSIEKWKKMKMKDVAEKIVVGYVGPVTQYIVQTGGIKFLSTTHIGENEFLNHDIREVSTVFNEKNKKSQVIPGDIIIARHGDSGKSCIIPDWIKIAQVSNAVIFRPNPQIVSSKFICYRLNAERHRMQKMKVGGVFQVVNTKSMESFETFVPPIHEQQRIIQEIENRLSVADKMDESIIQSLQKAESLRQSILKKAFSSELVT